MLAKNYGEDETIEMNDGNIKHDVQSEIDIGTLYEKGFKPRKAELKTAGDICLLNLTNLAQIRRDFVFPDNRFHRFFYGLIMNDPPIVGVPDAIGLEKRGYYVVYERKRTVRNGNEPFMGQRMQVCAYLMMLEALGYRKHFGVIHTGDDRKGPDVMRIFLTDEDRIRVLETATRIKQTRALLLAPPPTSNWRKCVKCQMGPNLRNLCIVSPLLKQELQVS
jgi:CRISPR/Cas system-associated exonuclease Cas4 (RecB family)